MSGLRVGVALTENRAVAVLVGDNDVVLASHAVAPAGREPAAREPAAREPAGREPAGREPAAREPADRESATPEPGGREPADREPAGPEPARASSQTPDPVLKPMCRIRHISGDFVPHPAHHHNNLPDLLRRVLTGLADATTLASVERVVVATSAPVDLLDRPEALRPVGVLRIGAPATTSVPPLTGWPRPLADAVRGPVAVVGGGHRYDGREFAPLDVGAIRTFAEACRGTVAAVAVTGADAHMNPEHEERARGVLTELLGPDIPVVTSHDVGGAGLLERENTGVLGAAVAPVVQRFTDDAVAALAAIGVGAGAGADLYLVTGDGTVLPASRAVRHPLALVSAQASDAPVEAGLFSDVAGVRTGVRGPRVTGIPRPPSDELAAAIGAATGEASGTVDRVYFYGDGGREECVATARRSARELAIRRGADPRTVRVGEVREGAMTYVPVRCVRLRVTATGPVMATGGNVGGAR